MALLFVRYQDTVLKAIDTPFWKIKTNRPIFMILPIGPTQIPSRTCIKLL